MIEGTNWQEQSGGLLLAVTTVDASDTQHLEAAIDVMQDTHQAIAQRHGAKLDTWALQGNVNAILTGRMHADLYRAKWKDCAEEICVGGAFGWDTYGFTPGGVLVKAEYTEDVALPTNLLKKLIRAKPRGKKLPEGLAQCFERISLQNMLQNKGMKYRFGEVSPDNTTMVRQLNANGALIGKDRDSAIVEFERFPNDLLNSFPMMAKASPIILNGVEDKNNFFVRLHEDEHDMRFVVAHAQATGSGKSRVDVHGWNNGVPVSKTIWKCAINSSFLTIKREVEEREWGAERTVQYPNVMATLLKARPDLASALYPEDGGISVPTAPERTFPAPMPETHVFIHGKRQMLDGVYGAGGVERLYGEKPMKPVVNILSPGLS